MYYGIFLQFNGRERKVFESNTYGECELFMLHFHTHALRLHSTGKNPYSWKHDVMTTESYKERVQ